MKHLKKYNENTNESFTKEDLEFIFAHSFDLSDDHNISEVYFTVTKYPASVISNKYSRISSSDNFQSLPSSISSLRDSVR